MKKILLSIFFISLTFLGFSQSDLEVQHNSKGSYVVHTVHPKDNFYSIGRLYNISPKEIAAFNALDMSAGLSVGQTVLIPLTAANFSQAKATGTPVYYVVGEKEGLYRVSMKNNKVLMASLRKWNHLANDNISTGQKLIVGFLQAPGYSATVSPVAKNDSAPPVVKEVQQPKKEVAQEVPNQPAPPLKETQSTDTKPVEGKASEVKSATPVSKPATGAVATGAGYFKSQYELQTKAHKAGLDATVTSGIFKTTSGFQDAKYYALMDKVEPGTIVQVVNPVNNKSIYAKVLGEMSGIRQNQGLDLRISNAAATALEINEPDKFIVRVLY